MIALKNLPLFLRKFLWEGQWSKVISENKGVSTELVSKEVDKKCETLSWSE